MIDVSKLKSEVVNPFTCVFKTKEYAFMQTKYIVGVGYDNFAVPIADVEKFESIEVTRYLPKQDVGYKIGRKSEDDFRPIGVLQNLSIKWAKLRTVTIFGSIKPLIGYDNLVFSTIGFDDHYYYIQTLAHTQHEEDRFLRTIESEVVPFRAQLGRFVVLSNEPIQLKPSGHEVNKPLCKGQTIISDDGDIIDVRSIKGIISYLDKTELDEDFTYPATAEFEGVEYPCELTEDYMKVIFNEQFDQLFAYEDMEKDQFIDKGEYWCVKID